MKHLSRFIQKAFSREVPYQSRYVLSPWSIVFVERTWDIYFELYFYKKRIAHGNTGDKMLIMLDPDPVYYKAISESFGEVLPRYKVKTAVQGEV